MGMDLEEKSLDPAVPERCQVCGAQLIPSEQRAVLESGSPPLCSIHAAEDVPLEEEQEAEAP
jgi:hypothetical protein